MSSRPCGVQQVRMKRVSHARGGRSTSAGHWGTTRLRDSFGLPKTRALPPRVSSRPYPTLIVLRHHVNAVPAPLAPDVLVECLARPAVLRRHPLAVVFDQAKTVVVGREDGRPVWNATLAQVAIDYGFAVELCAPRSPEQKGSVENLVGFVKRSFFRARRFLDLEEELPRQLQEWLVETNEVRASRATGVTPAERLEAEQERMRPLATPPADYGLRFPVHVGPTALVS